MRKVIGLIPLWDDERESYWMLPGYMKLIEQCGGLPMMLPMTDDEKMLDQALGLCDGLLFTGGQVRWFCFLCKAAGIWYSGNNE